MKLRLPQIQLIKIAVWLMLLQIETFSQGLVVGIVKDSTGSPIPGALIMIKGTSQIVETDEFGAFRISNPHSKPYVLMVNSVGYLENTIHVNEYIHTPLLITLKENAVLDEVVATSRRRQEELQDIPIAITVIGGQQAEEAGAFNVNRLKELVPSVQLYSSNARNTTMNIRGLGSTFGLTNDGIEPGVGLYIDGVYHARPAATALDFVDVNQIEVLRGPQGTLFGKNTTAGAFNITSRKPSDKPEANVEFSYGNDNFIQAKGSMTGAIAKNLSTRVSFSGTQRTGTTLNPKQQQRFNGLNNLGTKLSLLYNPTSKVELLISFDYSEQRPDGFSLVPVGVTRTLRSEHRQYQKIIEDLGYKNPYPNPFDRKIDSNSPWRHDQEIGGTSLNSDIKIGKGSLTSTTA